MNSDFWKIYNDERDKLTPLPDADADFIALDKAITRFNQEGGGNEQNRPQTSGEDYTRNL